MTSILMWALFAAGACMDWDKQLAAVLTRLDRGLKNGQNALALRIRRQTLMLREHLTERVT